MFRGLERPAFADQIVRVVGGVMQLRNRVPQRLIRFGAHAEFGERPNGIQLGFAINEVLEVSGDLNVGHDVFHRLGRAIHHRDYVGGIHF